MKTIQLREFENFSSKDIIREVLKRGDPRQGMDIEEMGRRWEILKKLEKSDDSLELEDAEWEKLKALYRSFSFAIVDEALLEVRKDIEEQP